MQFTTRPNLRLPTLVLGLALLSGCALFGLDVEDDYDGSFGGGEGVNGANAIECSTAPILYLGSPRSEYIESDYGSQACGSLGVGSNDHVYLFTPPQSGTYRFSVTASFDAVLYLIDHPCTTSIFEAVSIQCTDQGFGNESFQTYLIADGEPVLVVVDGYSIYEYGGYQLVAELVEESTGGSCRQLCTTDFDCGLGDYPEACLATTAGMICMPAECAVCFNSGLSCTSDPDTCEFAECS